MYQFYFILIFFFILFVFLVYVPKETSKKFTGAIGVFATIVCGYTLYQQIRDTEERKLKDKSELSNLGYADILKLVLTNPNLNDYYESIHPGTNVDEYAFTGILLQQMENVRERHNCKPEIEDFCRNEAWEYIFQIWSSSPIFRKIYPQIISQFNVSTKEYVDKLMNLYDRGIILYPIK